MWVSAIDFNEVDFWVGTPRIGLLDEHKDEEKEIMIVMQEKDMIWYKLNMGNED